MTTARRRALGTLQWRRARGQALVRDGGRCVACGARALVVGHRVSPDYGGSNDDLSNLVSLCRACNVSQASQDYDEWLGRTTGRPALIRSGALRPTFGRSAYGSRPAPIVERGQEAWRYAFRAHWHPGRVDAMYLGDMSMKPPWTGDGCPPECTVREPDG